MTGRLQIKNDRYYMIFNYKDTNGKYKQKWVKTGLSVQNNKRKAEQMLRFKLQEFKDMDFYKADIHFTDFVLQWLEVKKIR